MLAFRLYLLVVFMVASLALGADIVTPSSIHPGMTRTEADASLPKDYRWQILSDKTVRRMWQYADRTVLADFNTQTDKCVFFSFVYPMGIEMQEGLLAASELVQGAELQLKKLSAAKQKALQMQNADFGELADGSYLFVEKRKDGRVIRISWYQLPPASSRMTLTALTRVDKTLLGSRGDERELAALMEEERQRQGTARPRQEGAADSQRVVVMTSDGYVPDYDHSSKPKKRVSIEMSQVDKLKQMIANLEPVHWSIAGLVLLLLVGWCFTSSRK